MHKHPTISRFRTALGIIAFTATGVAGVSVAANTATLPARAASSTPTRTTGPMGYQCYQNGTHDSKTRYVLTNVYVDEWDLASDTQSTPITTEALRYRYHVSKQNWDAGQSQYTIENDWENYWGGPDQIVPISNSYFLPNMVCTNLIGTEYEYGVRTD